MPLSSPVAKLLKRRRSKFPFGVIGVSLVVLVGGGLALLYGGSFRWSFPWLSPTQGSANGSGPDDVGPVVHLDPFLVTEWEDDRQRLVTITFELEVADSEGRDAVKSRTSVIRSAILSLLADTQLGAVGDPADFERLKAKVQSRLQPLLPEHPIRRVLITDFLTL
jgi:flagellar basal body-associated protein FliL